MSIGDRLVRRRRLVLGALVGGPADTAAVAARVRGQFYEVYGVLSDLKLAGEVERAGGLWRLRERGGDELPREWVNPGHTGAIGTPGDDLEQVVKIAGEVGEDRRTAPSSPHLSARFPRIFRTPQTRS